ncbi:hypothetical protein [Algivirga pacifica]|uniref:DUF7793 domain-containing protein n=1 Tax=Algivirga pacifica TaxID=1162670 RepID=A0ABP9DF10_9BACT
MNNVRNIIKKSETQFAEIYLSDGILFYDYKPMNELSLKVAEECVQDRILFSNKTTYPCLFNIQSVKEVSKDARDYLANEGNQYILASAIVISSPIVKMLANFFIRVNKPKNPTKIFTDEVNAVEWLNQFNKTNDTVTK